MRSILAIVALVCLSQGHDERLFFTQSQRRIVVVLVDPIGDRRNHEHPEGEKQRAGKCNRQSKYKKPAGPKADSSEPCHEAERR